MRIERHFITIRRESKDPRSGHLANLGQKTGAAFGRPRGECYHPEVAVDLPPPSHRPPALLPDAFRAPRALRRLNVVAVAASLAACTGVVFAMLGPGTFSDPEVESPSPLLSPAIICALSTLGYGLLWARVVRLRTRRGLPFGWLAAVPLAAMNAGTALGILMEAARTEGSSEGFAVGFVAGATFGAILWIPALIVTLGCYGLPLYLAQRAADKGVGSEDRGERTVGVAAATFSVCATLFAPFVTHDARTTLVLLALALLGVAAGVASAAYSNHREEKRRAFLREVESGAQEGYRLERPVADEEGASAPPSMLVRVYETGEAYRSSTLAEPVLELDEEGDMKRALVSVIQSSR